ncbi:LTA synthase family protein [Vagococcus acidifermentans]|nr:LTA synthase family protein [Vagococcus acidifermentans]
MKNIIHNNIFPLKKWRLAGQSCATVLIVLASNYYLQLCQNDFSWELATKFAISWHTEKFLLGAFVLLVFQVFLLSAAGSWLIGTIFYVVILAVLGYANYWKLFYRMEPIYPDDLKMITEFGLMKDIIGTVPFSVIICFAAASIFLFVYAVIKSLSFSKTSQVVRIISLVVSTMLLVYISDFNNEHNLLRKTYNKTAAWIPYSQKMNYYNTGFMGGFLYNLKVTPMDKPEDYTKASVNNIVSEYNKKAAAKNETVGSEQILPNIVYIMSESFSDPLRINGISVEGDPLADYRQIADSTFSGQMLSQNYGGGTANVEFEALTGFAMEVFAPQMTTPYTMLLPKIEHFPSIVSSLKEQGYKATAIHPYNTSMYKRQDVYQTLGFDKFLDESSITDAERPSLYISDEAAYNKVLEQLSDDRQPNFVHLVTMQNHLPYEGVYESLKFPVTGDENQNGLTNYAQGIYYSSRSLPTFLQGLDELDRPTLVVFWGDHLPSLYSDETKEKNSQENLHLTEYFIYGNQAEVTPAKETISPMYFYSLLSEKFNQPTTGFNELLLAVKEMLPAFESGMYYHQGEWQEELSLSKEEEALYHDYQLIQYDITAGKQYSLDTFFTSKVPK